MDDYICDLTTVNKLKCTIYYVQNHQSMFSTISEDLEFARKYFSVPQWLLQTKCTWQYIQKTHLYNVCTMYLSIENSIDKNAWNLKTHEHTIGTGSKSGPIKSSKNIIPTVWTNETTYKLRD